ncbi:MAG: hypothetical protein WBH38_06105 [Defluviitoga tunisiensis]
MGWTIEYIIWNLSPQQLILLSRASEEIYNHGEKETYKLEEMDEEETLKQIFGVDIFEESEVKKDA